MMFKTVETVRLGMTSGMVILKSLCQKPAPSTADASYRLVSMLCRPDKTQKVTNGTVTKMPIQHSHAKVAVGVDVQLI